MNRRATGGLVAERLVICRRIHVDEASRIGDLNIHDLGGVRADDGLRPNVERRLPQFLEETPIEDDRMTVPLADGGADDRRACPTPFGDDEANRFGRHQGNIHERDNHCGRVGWKLVDSDQQRGKLSARRIKVPNHLRRHRQRLA